MTATSVELFLAFYGDDFTGSTDALEFLSKAGIKTVLFIEPPTKQKLSKYSDIQSFGVAGMTRSMPPEAMEKVLLPAFTALSKSGAPHVHYKVCSTFDSSPKIGSIGKAIDIGAKIFKSKFVPLLVAAPALGRYCAFGNLFARLGIGSKGAIYRLDRHPSMSKHPVTPADESDLRLHLSRQTNKKIGLIDILQIASDKKSLQSALENLITSGSEIVLFDALYEDQLVKIGELIDAYAEKEKPLFSVGSSGIEMALGDYLNSKGLLQSAQNWPEISKTETLLVISGSCSPVTSSQITYALENNFVEVTLDTEAIARAGNSKGFIEKEVIKAVSSINAGKSVIVHTSSGDDDPRVEKTNSVFAEKGFDQDMIRTQTAQLYGTALGKIAKSVAEKTSVKRIIIAGGDTSSFAARAMGIEAVEMIALVSPGAPLCKAFAPGSAVDGLEVNFKGGQVGAENYFELVLQGKNSDS